MWMRGGFFPRCGSKRVERSSRLLFRECTLSFTLARYVPHTLGGGIASCSRHGRIDVHETSLGCLISSFCARSAEPCGVFPNKKAIS